MENEMNVHSPLPLAMALCLAAGQGRIKEVREGLQQGADLNSRDSYGRTALQCAVIGRHADVAQILLSCGADTEQTNDVTGETALHEASKGAPEIVSLLLDHGACINAVGDANETPLLKAVKARAVEVVNILIKKGADLSIKDRNVCTLLHHAASQGDADLVKLLLSQGAEINALSADEWTPLDYAIEYGNVATVQALEDNGARGSMVWLQHEAAQQSLRAQAEQRKSSKHEVVRVLVTAVIIIIAGVAFFRFAFFYVLKLPIWLADATGVSPIVWIGLGVVILIACVVLLAKRNDWTV